MNEGGGGKKASAKVQLNFQICFKTPFPIMDSTTHCSPHFIPVPTPWTVEEGGVFLVAARAQMPEFIRTARANAQFQNPAPGQPGLANDPCLNNYASVGGYPAPGGNLTGVSAENTSRYLARLSAGESSGNRNWGPKPAPGSNVAWGEYQFRGTTRATLMARYPNLDPWSSDKTVRDNATLAWIGMYGQERKINILGAIAAGDFELADRVLGQNQFPSVPGGTQEVSMWRNPANLALYGPAGRTGAQPLPNCSAPRPPNPSPSTAPGQRDYLPGPGVLMGDFGGTTSAPGGRTGLSTGRFANPTQGPITSGFGPRNIGLEGASTWHGGIDISARRGTPVRASDGGVILPNIVTSCREGQRQCGGRLGNAVRIRHDNGSVTVYGHLQNVNVQGGQRVNQGQQIGTVGNTGNSTGPHLHFEIRDPGGNRLNPALFIRK
jgi:Peptidase family M23